MRKRKHATPSKPSGGFATPTAKTLWLKLSCALSKALRQQIAGAVDLVIQSNRLQGGKRRVTHITEIVGMEQDTVVMQDIYHYVQEGIDEQGRARGRFDATGIRPTFMDRLEAAGVRLPASAFRQRTMMLDY